MLFYLVEVFCGTPPHGLYTEIPQTVLMYLDTYNYSCMDGYWTNDPILTQCQADGTFSLNNPPVCTSKLLRRSLQVSKTYDE